MEYGEVFWADEGNSTAKGNLPRDAAKAADTWDLSPMYASLSDWKSDIASVKKRSAEITKFQGTLSTSASAIKNAFDLYLQLSRSLEKIYTYAHLRSDEDTSNSANLGQLDETIALYGEFSAAASFLIPELLAIDEITVNKFLASSELAHLQRFLTEIIRYKPHTLSKEEEAIIAFGTELYGTSEKVFSQLTNADFTFRDIEVDGEKYPLSHGTFALLLKNNKRRVRQAAFDSYYAQYSGHRHTIAAAYTASVKKDLFFTRIKKYPSTLERSLFADDVSRDVYDNLIQTVSTNLSPLHRYYELRKRVLKEQQLFLYDTYVPLVADVKQHTPYNEAVTMILESLAPLGGEYGSVLKQGLMNEHWVDRYENRGKRSGAYSSGCYDSFPYMLMNYREDDINSVFTLTHEAGHSMHSYYSRKQQSYQDHSYTIFVAEVASIFNEELLLKFLRERHRSDAKMTAFLVNHEIDEIKSTLYRQTMFAEYERAVHDRAGSGEPLTIDYYLATYHELLKKYFGPAVEIRDDDALECLRIPHFYSSFYVYKYATGISAAISLAKQVLSGDTQARERYLKFLCSGCTKYPLDLLQDAGVNMRTSAAIQKATSHFGSLVDDLAGALT